MGKTKSRLSDPRTENIYRVSLGAAAASFVGGLVFFASTAPVLTFVFAIGMGAAIGFLSLFVLSALFRPASKIEATFTFENATLHREKASAVFEYEVAGLIHKMTGKRTEVVDDNSDGGIDIKVYEEDGRLLGVVQCQNLAAHKTTHPAYIRDLNIVRRQQQVSTAYLVSTGRFSDESLTLAQQLGIKLIDGQALTQMRRKAS